MKLPEWVGPGTRVVDAELPPGYVPPSASTNPAATVEGKPDERNADTDGEGQ